MAITDNCVRIRWLLALCQNVVIIGNCGRMWYLLVLTLCQNVVIIENCVRMWRLLILVLEYGGYWYCVRM